MDSLEKAVQVLQYSNIALTTISSFLTYGYVIHRIRSSHASHTQYHNLLMVQSSLYICGSALGFLVNHRVSLDGKEKTGYPFIEVPKWMTATINSLDAAVEAAEGFALVAFNVHRVLLFIKPQKLKLFYIITTPPAICCIAFVGFLNASFENIADYCFCFFYAVILSIVCVCYFILRKHFRLTCYSHVVIKAQNKLSKGLLLQIILQVLLLAMLGAGPGLSAMVSFFNQGSNTTVTRAINIFNLVAHFIFVWYPVIIGFIIKWSISGLLTDRRADNRRTAPVTVTRAN